MNPRYYFSTFTNDNPSRPLITCEDMEAERFPVTPVIVEIYTQYSYVFVVKLQTKNHQTSSLMDILWRKLWSPDDKRNKCTTKDFVSDSLEFDGADIKTKILIFQ